jgi:hypothetical protein
MNKRSQRRGKIIFIKGIDPRSSNIDKLRHIFKVVRNHYKDLYWWRRESSRYIFEIYYKKAKGNEGIYVVDENWDNLIILDACRYDVLREVMGEAVGYRISRGSSTLELVRENFTDEKYDDIVYVTGNPWVHKVAGNSFYRLISVWKDGWDDNLGTVLPGTMTEYALEAAKSYPDKRLIVHYMQPHAPYIVEHNLSKKRVEYVWEFMRELERGQLDPQVVRDIYKRSLEAALPHVLELVKGLKGKTVISADHGELFGKKVLFFTFAAHPWGLRVPELVQVPWVEFENGERKAIKKGDDRRNLKHRISKLKDEGRV